jgi:hypothetical protein
MRTGRKLGFTSPGRIATANTVRQAEPFCIGVPRAVGNKAGRPVGT